MAADATCGEQGGKSLNASANSPARPVNVFYSLIIGLED